MRILRPLLALLLVVATVGASDIAPKVSQRWVRTTVAIAVGGLARSYLVVRPAGSGKTPLPVMVDLHGAGATPELELDRSGFLTDSDAAIMVLPTGINKFWNTGACCGNAQTDDLPFITAVVKQVLATQPRADPTRVYLAGYSNGGRLAYNLACADPKLFTAIAIFGAVNAQPCIIPRAVPMMIADGTNDPDVLLTPTGVRHTVNGYVEPAVTEEVEQYRVANGCTTTATKKTIGKVVTTTWTNCTTGYPVRLALFGGANHLWPLTIGSTPGMAALAWAFFKTQQTLSRT